jgi:peptidoglycan/xylan/chitin deacetylase (PgdA/CDA1 family)
MFDLTLTFDNGPTAVTPTVLDLLAEYKVKSTFFVIGKQMADPAMRRFAERAAAEGHWIGNHTYSHSVSLGNFADLDASVDEIASTERLIGPLAREERLFRPFGNSGILDRRVLNQRALEHLQAERYTVVLWNALPRDWVDADWVDRAVEQCSHRPWSLMVLHDREHRAIPGLERFLPRALAMGARFRQDFPDECVPIRRGVLTASVEHLVAQPI